MVLFDKTDKTHKHIVWAACATADVFGLGRMSSAKEELESYGITAYTTKDERDVFERFVFNYPNKSE